MPKTLVIPDFHEQVDKIPTLEKLVDQAERVVSLGDWCDTFGEHRVEETLEFICKYSNDKRWTWLIGNHDASYMYTHQYFRCSGYREETQKLWHKLITPEITHKWKIWTEAEGFLVSHAGFDEQTIKLRTAEDHEAALQAARDGGFHAIWMPGEDSGGYRGFVGGPTWLRWKNLGVLDLPQVVGHTNGRYIRYKGHLGIDANSYCIDTNLRHCVWLDNGTLEPVLLDKLV